MIRALLNFLDDVRESIWDRFCWFFIGMGILIVGICLLASDLFFKKNSTP